MKIAHLADLHLGFRQFWRETAGNNTRELDVATALGRTVDDLITQRPDVIVVAGDVFHSSRPRTSPIMLLFSELARLRAALPGTRIIMVAGNHDTAKTMEITPAGCILPLYAHLDVDVAVVEPKVIQLPGITITAVPSGAAAQIITPDRTAACNVLVIHGQVTGGIYPIEPMATSKERIDRDELERMGWDYVALGDYHVCHQVGPQMWYSGAIEYTTTNPWGELQKQNELGVSGKGYLLVSLEPRQPAAVEFRPIGPARRFVDLPPIEGTDKTAAQLDAEIASRVAETAIDGAVVRLVVREVRRAVKKDLNHTQIREWRGRALHFQLELRTAESEQSSPTSRAAVHRRIDETVAHFLRERQIPPDMDRKALVEKGLEYIRAAAVEDPYTGERAGSEGETSE